MLLMLNVEGRRGHGDEAGDAETGSIYLCKDITVQVSLEALPDDYFKLEPRTHQQCDKLIRASR